MKIRKANKFDFPEVAEMLHRYKKASPSDIIISRGSEDFVKQIFTAILAGKGVALLAEENNKTIGILLAVIDPLVWDPSILIMRELAYYVEEEHRGSTAGYRLLAEYKNAGEELMENGRIEAFTINKMVNSPDLKYDKFGFRKIEETWVNGV